MSKPFETIVLENDNWFHAGTEEFLEKFGEYKKVNPSLNDQFFEKSTERMFCMILCQPFIKRVVAVSTFEMEVSCEKMHEKGRGVRQLEFYASLVQEVDKFREMMGYGPIEYHLVDVSGGDMLKHLHKGEFGDALDDLYLFARQSPKRFKVKVYGEDFEKKYYLNQKNLAPKK